MQIKLPLILLLLSTLSLFAPMDNALAEGSSSKDEWVTFNGIAEPGEKTFLLKAADGGGSFEVSRENVRLRDNTVEVRVGIKAKIVEQPQSTPEKVSLPGTDNFEPSQPCHIQDDCESKCCACIGLVRICCGSGGTRGICLGIWSCPG